ncbi:tetratricopeptide repeat protein [Saccharopolyspora shandongensis]
MQRAARTSRRPGHRRSPPRRCGSAHMGLADIEKRSGLLDAAAARCRRALVIDPDSATALMGLADVESRRGQLEEADVLVPTVVNLSYALARTAAGVRGRGRQPGRRRKPARVPGRGRQRRPP